MLSLIALAVQRKSGLAAPLTVLIATVVALAGTVAVLIGIAPAVVQVEIVPLVESVATVPVVEFGSI